MASIFLQTETIQDPAYPWCLRSLKKYASPHGGNYLGVSVNSKRPYLILGTNVTPLTTPTGVKKIEGQNGTWHNLSVALPEAVQAGLDFVDGAMLATLARSSEALFGMEMTVAQLLKAKYYIPLVYRKEDSDLEPLFSGKVTEECVVVDKDNKPLAHDVTVNPGSKVRVVVAIGSLFFKSDNQCRLTTKVSRIQLLEEGEDQADAEGFMFD